MEYIHHYHSPLGGITVASDGEVLTGLWFDGQKYFAVTLAKEHEEKMLPVFEETDRWLDIYFQGKEPDFLPPVSFASGSEFRQEVWKILLSIPYGKTMTYGEIAACIAKQRGLTRMSAQAVGGAVGHNPISIIVPCHRVVGTDGSLTGYAGGIDKKIKLLEYEHMDVEQFYVPKKGTICKNKTIVSQTMCALAERLSQSEIELPLRKICYYSPLAEVGVSTQTEMKY